MDILHPGHRHLVPVQFATLCAISWIYASVLIVSDYIIAFPTKLAFAITQSAKSMPGCRCHHGNNKETLLETFIDICDARKLLVCLFIEDTKIERKESTKYVMIIDAVFLLIL